jgi:hypothetical protein
MMRSQGPAALALALGLGLAGCVNAPPLASPALPQAEAPAFDPFTFFLGTSEGTGTLAKAMADDVPVRVTSTGRIETEARRESAWAAPPRQVLVLDQVVTEGDKPLRQRQWRLTEVAPGRYEGTLSEAIGPVEARAEGNRLVITFTIKGGFAVRQELTLAPDGRSAANVLTVKKLGMTLAVLSEDIRKTP